MQLAVPDERRHGVDSPKRDQRSPGQRDRDRILYSDPFRRLQGVTQVVSADEGSIFHNRLTHSIKVAQVARRIAEHLLRTVHEEDGISQECLARVGGLDPDCAEAAALGHDLGHPPFGHVAETTLQKRVDDEEHFEGNAQSFRIVTRLAIHSGEYRGLDLTRRTLAGLLKYPWKRSSPDELPRSKYGYYERTEGCDFEFAREMVPESDECRTLEAEIMDLADDITFAVHDMEDFFRAGMIPLQDLKIASRRSVGHPETRRFLDDVQSRWERQGKTEHLAGWEEHVEALKEVLALLPIDASFTGRQEDLLALSRATSGLIGSHVQKGLRINSSWDAGERRVVVDSAIELQLTMLKELVWTYVIDRPSLATQQRGHAAVIEALFEFFKNSIEKDDRRLISPSFHFILDQRNEQVESDERLAADMVCSLTDRQALELFKRVTGFDPGSIVAVGF